MKNLKKINWLNTLFLTITPVVAIVGTVLLCVYSAVSWKTWLFTGIMVAVSGLSITAGYHRLFSHATYKAAWPVRLFFAFFGAGCFQGSALEWCTDHRNHHLYTDTDKDPYSIKKGFWYAHIGWLFVLDQSKRDFSNVEELAKDPILKVQHNFYTLIATIVGFGFPMLIASFWGEMWAGLILAGALRATISHHVTFCINSICHMFGRRTYSTKQSARDNWFTALVTYGEGYHNFHHQFPLDYRNGIRVFDYDPTKWIINLLSYCGLATNLKQVSKEKIIKYRVMNDHNDIVKKVTDYSDSLLQQVSVAVKPVRERIMQLIQNIEELEKNYRALKKEKMDGCREQLNEYRQSIKNSRRELQRILGVWKHLVRCNQKLLLA